MKATKRYRDLRPALEHVLRTLASQPRVPSLVVYAGDGAPSDPCVAFTAGHADLASLRPPTLDTVYGIGSTSKAFAAVSVLRLVGDGMVKLHDPVRAVLRQAADLPILDGVTLHHLLSHTSGLPPLDARYAALDRAAPGVYSGGLDRTRPAGRALPSTARGLGFRDHVGLLEYLAGLEVDQLAPPGRQFSYSNEGYILLAGVASELTGESYEDFCRAHVLEPLGLSSTAFIGSPAAASLADVAIPYSHDSTGLTPATWWDAPAWAAPGGLLSSANDLLRFAHAVQHRAVPGIAADLVATLSAPHAVRSSPGTWYGYGLRGALIDSQSWIGHAGSRIGTRADMMWVDDGPAAVSLVNHQGGPAPSATRAALLALGGDDPGRVLDGAPIRRYLPAAAFEPARIVGEYTSAEGHVVRIACDDQTGQVVASADEPHVPEVPLQAVSADVYEVRLGAAALTMRFLIDGTAPAWGVELAERVLTRAPAVRRRVEVV